MKSLLSVFLSILFLFASQTQAAISYISSVTDRGNDDKASLIVPATTLLGDVMIAQVTFRNRNGSDGVTTPSGWTPIAPQDRDDNVFQSAYYKVATATDGGTSYEWDFDGNGNRRYILGMSIFRGVDNINPLAVENSSTAGASSSQLIAPSVTTINASSMLVAMYTLEAGDQSFTPATGMAEIYDIEENNNNNGLTSMMSWELFPAVSATGDRVAGVSKSSDDGIGHLIALNEGSSGPVVTSLLTSCASLTTITINFSQDLDISSAENEFNYSLTNAALNPIVINTAILTTPDSVTLTTNSSLFDLTPYTLVMNNIENLTGDIIAVNSSENFMLRCDSNCITDNFVGPGPLSDSWSVGNSSGSFGDPTIVASGRLRLTDASNSVATFATLLNQFPGADNRIEIEFDYYGYDGNGADGIAINVSDASILPVAGAAGGSLGYAQKTGVNGFSGGWLGVGIDEYGNFSNPTEGREGGIGRTTDSVSLRGSGSGTSGYPYLTGTSNLSPGVDQSGSTPNPGHRYKVVIDHTASGSTAIVSVARDTGSGYVSIVPEFDVFLANPSQAAVPANWVVSFTGSTGGSTNIHEIGDLKVCAAQPIQTFSIVDHYEISHTSPGLTCEASQITITAHDINHDPINVLSDTSISLTTTPSVTGIVTSPVIMLTGNSTADIYLQQIAALASVDIDVSDGTFTDDDGSSEDPQITFLDTAFRFYADGSHTDVTPISSQISGKPSIEAPGVQTLVLRAIQTNTDTGACEAALVGNQTVDIAYTCKDPSSCSARQLSFTAAEINVTGTNDGAGLSYTGVDMLFDVSGSAPVRFNFPDAGKIQLHANLIVPEASPEPEFTLTGNSNEFVVRPFSFDLGFTGSYSAADENGTRFVSAGTPFPMTIRAVNWEEADDTDDDGIADIGSNVTNNLVAINFGQELSGSIQTLAITHTLNTPSSGLFGALTSTTISTGSSAGYFTSGLSSESDLTWDEVGIIDIDVSLSNYLTANGANISGETQGIGRFSPHQFSMVSSNLVNSCGIFSYMGQPNINISFTLEAQNIAGNRTHYYNGGFVKMIPLNHIALVAENNNDGGSYQARLNGFLTTNWADGEYIYSDGGSFSRAALGSVDGPYQDLQVGVQIVDDNDGGLALLTVMDMRADTSTNCSVLGNCDAKNIDLLDPLTPLNIRFGQLKLSNAFGPETFALDMNVQTEYFNNTDFILNTDDNCTDLSDANLIPVVGSWVPNLDDGETAPTLTTNITAGAGGVGEFSFNAAGLGNEGSVDFQYDTINFLPWLNTENTGNGDYLDNPFGKITFGQFRGNDRMIYWREVVR